MQLILASQSKGRKKLLSLLRIPFATIPSQIDEEKIVAKNPLETLRLRAQLKGEEILTLLSKKTNAYCPVPNTYLVLSADSGAILADKLIGKPKDYHEAIKILKTLSGKTHQFVTVYYVVKINKKGDNKIWQGEAISYVTFRKLKDHDIEQYLRLTNYTKYAGGYALFASPQDFITRVIGSLSNVIGLPLEKIIPILQKNGFLGV